MSDNEMKWRDLALQFDGHRMQAIGFLKMILAELPGDQFKEARDFLNAGPLSGEEVLHQRLAALRRSDWISWDGNIDPTTEPVAGKVTVRFRDGQEDTDNASVYYWGHMGDHADIIGYKISGGEADE